MDQPLPNYELTFYQRDGYLHALIRSDTMTAEMAVEYLAAVAAECRKSKNELLLLERDVPVMLNDIDLFNTTKYFLDLIGDRYVAFVNPHLAIVKDMDFAILVGTNRGANYQLFNNVPDAVEWLLRHDFGRSRKSA